MAYVILQKSHDSCCFLLPLVSKGFFFPQDLPWYCSGNRMDFLAYDLKSLQWEKIAEWQSHCTLLFYLLNLSQWVWRKRTVSVSTPETFNQVQRANWKAPLWLRMKTSQLSVWTPSTNLKIERQAFASCCLLPTEQISKS